MTAIDLDLVFFRFADAYHDNAEQAVHALYALLLDESACRRRGEFLRRLSLLANREQPERLPERPTDHSQTIRRIVEVGIGEALRDRSIHVEQLDALTCDPDALWQAHRALLEEGETPGPTGSGLTGLALGGDWEQFAARLEPYLPFVLQGMGLDLALVKEALPFVVERARTISPGQRIRDLLPAWLGELARREVRTPTTEEWHALVERAALAIVLSNKPAGEPPWATRFRDQALGTPLTSWQDVERLAAPAEAAPSVFPLFRRDLLTQVRKQRTEAIALWELS
jgi:hypothetical protein